jgi:Uma2 family endonuclease
MEATLFMPETGPRGDPALATYCLKLLPAVPMTQDQFFDFCQQNRKIRFERTAEGELIIMPPSGGESSHQNLAIAAPLYLWAKRDGTGEAFDSSAGFDLPNGATRSPDASWVLKSRLAGLTSEQRKKFLPLAPDFAAEVLSPTDNLRLTKEKMEEYLANGTRLGWLLNPRTRQVHVYRPGQLVQVVDGADSLAGDPELPGFVVDLLAVWKP